MDSNDFHDVVIIGGSYAGLSAAMCLGRALRNVLVIDSGTPCNRVVAASHNFLTNDGQAPQQLNARALSDLKQYQTVQFITDLATDAYKVDGGFEIKTQSGKNFQTLKLLFATGLEDLMPDIDGFKECWGKTVLHCPYCHGYEAKDQSTAIIGNGKLAYEMVKSVSNWVNPLTVFTNGKAIFSKSQREIFVRRNVTINEKPISQLFHNEGKLEAVVFEDGSRHEVSILYAHPHTRQQCNLFAPLGCSVNKHSCIKTDVFQKTNTYGIYAAGDCSSVGRSLSVAVAAGTVAGMFLNKELIDEEFK